VRRNVDVDAVHVRPDHLEVRSRGRIWRARAVISATGTWRRPHWPRYPGARAFRGIQIHTVSYRRPDPFSPVSSPPRKWSKNAACAARPSAE
jgi:putative flavoprotein involved in K+ transport